MTARGWFLTWNSPPADWKTAFAVETLQEKHVMYAVWQLEEVLTPHVQGYLEFENAVRRTAVAKMFPGGHVEKRLGTPQEAMTYCTKEATRIEGPWDFGTLPLGSGSRSDLEALTESIEGGATLHSLALEHARSVLKYHRGIQALIAWRVPARHRPDIQVTVYWGDTGTGKTRLVYEKEPDVFAVMTPTGKTVWFDGYEQQATVLFDDFRPSWMPLSYLLRLLDRYPMTVQVKGGTVSWNPLHVYLTCDSHPRTWFLEESGSQQLMRRISSILHFSDPISSS